MPSPLDTRTMHLVRASVPALEARLPSISEALLAHLYGDAELRLMLHRAGMRAGTDLERVVAAIIEYARNIDRMTVLARQVGEMAKRHVAAGVRPEHYGVVARSLMTVFRDALGVEATAETMQAWSEAYWVLAHILIEEEERLRGMAAQQD